MSQLYEEAQEAADEELNDSLEVLEEHGLEAYLEHCAENEIKPLSKAEREV